MENEQVIYEIGKERYIVNRYFVGKQTLEELLLRLIFGDIRRSSFSQ